MLAPVDGLLTQVALAPASVDELFCWVEGDIAPVGGDLASVDADFGAVDSDLWPVDGDLCSVDGDLDSAKN